MLRAVLLSTALTASAALDVTACSACTLAIRRLNGALNATKEELELSREANEKKSASIDKVQKAQTKRWLKREYGVALRAGVEEELEKV
jgi:protein-disulfide isomerase